MKPTAPTAFTQIRRAPKLAIYDREVMYRILDDARLAHVGHIIDGRPVVIPTLHWRMGDRVYWHGNAASRMLVANRAGGEVCLSVTIMDGWVMARSAFNHSANYRSLACFGTAEAVLEREEKAIVLKAFMDRRFPGRWEELRPVTEQELNVTLVLSMAIDEASAKVRDAGVDDPIGDLHWPVWAGVLPLRTVAGDPSTDESVPSTCLPPTSW